MSEMPAGGRRRDAARSRELLLQAATELFAERGFDRTTTREIGERAGVDPALIARYFGGKTQLYLAAVEQERGHDTPPADLLDEQRLDWLLKRVESRGPGPIFQATVLPSDDPAVREAARAHLYRRLIDPLRERFERDGVDRAQLRAELAIAAFGGVILARSGGALEELSKVDADELLVLLHELLGGARGQGPRVEQ